ncbi:PIN domain-containing protein [Haloferula sp. A504]|uniref:PIN domain-containing protein n=1 Tax=Haloferula sp. A504 TaxID=3373601 RepID=UPI00378EFFA7
MVQEGWIPLPLTLPNAADAASIEHPHRDPFDRMLAAQALSEGLVILTRDRAFPSLGVEVIW